MTTQAKGVLTQVVMGFEDSFNGGAASPLGYRLPLNTYGVKKARPKNKAATLTGTRNPAEPYDGNTAADGDGVYPVCSRSMFYQLKGMFNSPATTAGPAKTLDAGGAVNKGSGRVGLPCTAHGMAVGDQVQISDTSNYDGVYVLHSTTSVNELVVTASYAAESFSGTEVATPCIQKNPDAAAAVNKGDGLVGIPCTGHGLPVGAEITIANSVNYNDTYQVERGTSANEIVITDSFSSETFDGEETITALFWSHEFTVPDSMPSLWVDKGFTNISQYFLQTGLRASTWSLSVGGDGELTQTIGFLGANEARDTSEYDSDHVIVAMKRFNMFQAALAEGGATLTTNKAKALALDFGFGLDGDQYCIGDQGVRGDLPEGSMEIGGTLTALFEDETLLAKGEDIVESSLALTFTRGHYSLGISIEELQYEATSPPIDGPQGVLQELKFEGYWADGASGSGVVVTLVTDIKTYC